MTTVQDNDITVANVVGKTESEARKALGSLTVSVEYKTVTEGTNGVVLSQSVKAGSVVSKQAKITIVVSKLEAKNNNNNNNNNNSNNNNNNNNNNNSNNNGNTNDDNKNSSDSSDKDKDKNTSAD